MCTWDWLREEDRPSKQSLDEATLGTKAWNQARTIVGRSTHHVWTLDARSRSTDRQQYPLIAASCCSFEQPDGSFEQQVHGYLVSVLSIAVP